MTSRDDFEGDGVIYPRPPRTPLDDGGGWITPVEKLLVGCVLLLILAVTGLAAWASQEIAASKFETLQNRAVGCRLMRSLGININTSNGPEPCQTAAIRAYLSNHPDDITRIDHDRALCAVATKVKIPASELERFCGTKSPRK